MSHTSMPPRYDVVAVGNAIVDVLSHCDDDFLAAEAMPKGGMQLIDADRAVDIYEKMKTTTQMSGGSAANTAAGLASLGAKTGFIGKVATDNLGSVFEHDISSIGVTYNTMPSADGLPTARCLILITPDAQRTMNTFLGASTELTDEDIDTALIEDAKVTYLEGYLFDKEAAKRAYHIASQHAQGAGRDVALSLSDTFCVQRHKKDFQNLVEKHVDILFANEDEVMALYETEDFDKAVAAVRGKCSIAALTRGEKGSVIISGDQTIEVAAAPIKNLADTTGAGDLYAAGFLYGYTQGKDLATCGQYGSIAAAEVIQHVGARPSANLSDLIKAA